MCSDMVYGRPEVVKLVHDSNLLLVTWGKENSKEECVSWQKQQAEGIVIISDNLRLNDASDNLRPNDATCCIYI